MGLVAVVGGGGGGGGGGSGGKVKKRGSKALSHSLTPNLHWFPGHNGLWDSHSPGPSDGGSDTDLDGVAMGFGAMNGKNCRWRGLVTRVEILSPVRD